MINSVLLRLISDEVYSSNIGIIYGNIIMNDIEVKKVGIIYNMVCKQSFICCDQKVTEVHHVV